MKYYLIVVVILILNSCSTDKKSLKNQEKLNEGLLNCELIVPNILKKNNIYDIRKIELKKLVEVDSVIYNKNNSLFNRGLRAYYYSYLNKKCNLVLYVTDSINNIKSLWLYKIDKSGIIRDKLLLSNESFYPEFNSIKYSIMNENKIFINEINSYLDNYIDENNYSEFVDSICYEYQFSDKLLLIKKDSLRKKHEFNN